MEQYIPHSLLCDLFRRNLETYLQCFYFLRRNFQAAQEGTTGRRLQPRGATGRKWQRRDIFPEQGRLRPPHAGTIG